jgi:hypothetical protein
MFEALRIRKPAKVCPETVGIHENLSTLSRSHLSKQVNLFINHPFCTSPIRITILQLHVSASAPHQKLILASSRRSRGAYDESVYSLPCQIVKFRSTCQTRIARVKSKHLHMLSDDFGSLNLGQQNLTLRLEWRHNTCEVE